MIYYWKELPGPETKPNRMKSFGRPMSRLIFCRPREGERNDEIDPWSLS